jgi:hydrogenase maturation protease
MSAKRTAVIGVGNLLLSDEGAGVEVVRALEDRLGEVEDARNRIDVIDVGTCIFTCMPRLDAYGRIIFVDCVRGGGEAGTLYRFGLEDITRGDSAISLHEMGVLEALQLERLTGVVPRDVIFFGIEPSCVQPGLQVSPPVRSGVQRAVDAILNEIGG